MCLSFGPGGYRRNGVKRDVMCDIEWIVYRMLTNVIGVRKCVLTVSCK
jgi:hypothetical protein